MIARVVVVAMLVATASAAADVSIERDGVCTLDRLPSRITELVGETAGSGTIRVHTVRDGEIRAEIAVVGATTEPRVITGSDCEALVDPIVVIVGLLVRTLPAPRTIVPPPSVPTPPEPAVASTRTPLRAASLIRVLELGGGATFDGEPVLSLGGRIGRGLAAIGADLAVLPPSDRDTAMGHVRISSGRLTVAPCVEKWAIAGCALLSAGWVHGSRGTMHSATLPTTAFGARVEWRPVVWPRFGVRVFAESRYFATRAAFLVDDAPVWRSASSETLVGIGGFVRFP